MAGESERVDLTTAEREWLLAARREHKIPAKVLAKKLGITPAVLQKWQQGTRRPTGEQVVAWWKAVGP